MADLNHKYGDLHHLSSNWRGLRVTLSLIRGAGESGGLRVPVALRNAAGEPHWILHGKLIHSALPPRIGRGSTRTEDASTPVPVSVISGAAAVLAFEQLSEVKQAGSDLPHPSGADSLASPPQGNPPLSPFSIAYSHAGGFSARACVSLQPWK